MQCSWHRCKNVVFGKKYCSSKHRALGYLDRLQETSRKFEASAVAVAECPPELRVTHDEWKLHRPQFIIQRAAPPRAIYYRLGCSSPLAKSPMLRWFPPRHLVPLGLWTINPFEYPAVPFPGLYCVANFDGDGRFIHCDRRVMIEIAKPSGKWRFGDQGLELNLAEVAALLEAKRTLLKKPPA